MLLVYLRCVQVYWSSGNKVNIRGLKWCLRKNSGQMLLRLF